MSKKHLPAAVLVSIGCSVALHPWPYGPDDILKVAYAAREPVNARHHQHVAAAKEVQDGAKLLSSCGRRSAALL
jgi:hypothetical protein